jgi:small subunit ribosomal protein S9
LTTISTDGSETAQADAPTEAPGEAPGEAPAEVETSSETTASEGESQQSEPESSEPESSEPERADSPRAAAPRSQSSPATRPARRPAPVSQTTGRRKRAVARVRFRPGNGTITVNKRTFEDYFTSATHRMIVGEPLRQSNIADRYDIEATIDGGGISGQAGAMRLGITRALVVIDPELRTGLKRAGLLTRDAREKESKKYGLKKARKAPQYSKR